MKILTALINSIYSNKYIQNIYLPPEYTSQAPQHSQSYLQERLDKHKQEREESAPIFIFSAGWGCGSTLLQRLIMSSGEAVIWGEPLDRSIPIQRMASSLAAIDHDWPPDNHFTEIRSIKELSKTWVANLTPDLTHLKRAHTSFFKTWFEAPLQEYRATRWGIKEVRLTINHAHYLKWLFPNSKFIFIYRNLPDSYLSCKQRKWFLSWPKYDISSFMTFTMHWKLLTESFISRHHEVDGMLIRYEDLINNRVDIKELAGHLEIKSMEEDTFKTKIGSRKKNNKLNSLESFLLKHIQRTVETQYPDNFQD